MPRRWRRKSGKSCANVRLLLDTHILVWALADSKLRRLPGLEVMYNTKRRRKALRP